MRKLFYMSLEQYQSRYTYQLTDWSERAFKRRGVAYVIVPGNVIDNTQSIQVGQVLDAHGRSYFAMSQMMNLVQMMRDGKVTGEDVIFFEDMFQPGIESLPYIMHQIPASDRPKVWVRCLAQAVDPDDFVHVWGMASWMSHYEAMVNEFVTGVLASNEEMVAHMRIANWRAPIYNISGLAFDSNEVKERVDSVKTWDQRTRRVVFAARWDQEKQPGFFMDLVEAMRHQDPSIEFAVLQGSKLRSNNPAYVDRARQMQFDGKLSIYENLSKNAYYALLNDSRVLFNCALQDWTSNTVSEADALGCNVLYPAYRSFPEVFANDHTRMYVPWSQTDAINKLIALVETAHPDRGRISDWTSGTIDRCIDIMQGRGEQWARNDRYYREHASDTKY